jgi:GNAT superfamily N-acetyltransferase
MMGRAFVEEPMMLWAFGDHGDRARRFARFFEIIDASFVESDMLWEAGDSAGAAVWIPPHGPHGADHALVRTVDQLAEDPARCRSFWDWVGSMTPKEPMWVLDHVGVDPNRQGSGIGTALVNFGLARAAEGGVAAYLEAGNPRNVPYYERLGFSVLAHADTPDGGPHIWFMRCERPGAERPDEARLRHDD